MKRWKGLSAGPLTVASLTVAALALLVGVYIMSITRLISEDTQQKLDEVAKQTTATVNSQVSGDLQTLSSLAGYLSASSPGEIDFQTQLRLLTLAWPQSQFKRMGLITPEGTAYTTDGYTFNFSRRIFYLLGMQGQLGVADTSYDVVDNKPINVYYVPIYQNKEVVGVLFATVNNDLFQNLLSTSTFDGEGYSYVINSRGDLMVGTNHPNRAADFTNVFDVLQNSMIIGGDLPSVMQDKMERSLSGSTQYTLQGTSRQLNYRPLGVGDWYLLSVVGLDTVNEKSNSLITIAAISGGFILLLFTLLIFYVVRRQQNSQAQLEQMVYVDSITGGPTWEQFSRVSRELLNQKNEYAVVLFDIDKFKAINDLYGHSMGNQMLRSISTTTAKTLATDETYGRIHADNFIMLWHSASDEDLILRTQQLSDSINYNFPDRPLLLSFGIYRVTDSTMEASVFSDRATLAKKTIKGNHQHNYAFYSDAVRNLILQEKEIELEMANALKDGQFVVYLQPKNHVTTLAVEAAEALVRWRHPTKGMIPPGDFIPLFERNRFITRLDFYVFEQVVILLRRWLDEGRTPPPISVNISRVNLYDPDLTQNLRRITDQYHLDPGYVELEITESAVFERDKELIQIIHTIHQAGFSLSMDDFGSGYSSLNSLKNMMFDTIKLDREFLTPSNDETRSHQLIFSIIDMARRLGIRTVAEGVEEKSQLELLAEAGCDLAQGYYFSRPIPIDEFEKMAFPDENSSVIS